MILPAQQNSLHCSSWIFMPLQGNPPHEGMGLLHVLVRLTVPPPQVLLHVPTVHELHPP